MRKWISSFTLIEMLVVIAIIAILAGLLLPALARAREESRRKSCSSNLSQIVKACTTYQEPNGDFFPAFEQYTYTDPPIGPATGFSHTSAWPNAIPQANWAPTSVAGADGNFQPMPSLACLYPGYVDNVKVFGCPSTPDKPQIAFRYYNGARHTCFGFSPDPGETGTIASTEIPGDVYGVGPNGRGYYYTIDPAVYEGNEIHGNVKCSYLYDELSNFRDIGPGQAMACDADGFTWIGLNGKHPAYPNPGLIGPNGASWWPVGNFFPNGWARPTISNHDNGQNVMYFDGHVKWSASAYVSRDPNDNIFCPQGWFDPTGQYWGDKYHAGWGADTDAYLWDGCLGDSIQPGT
jgi:prepilin-type N-terminal cleavage/methylation domain-containing protein/prepilin-type processing-associated H-X9-DG protein